VRERRGGRWLRAGQDGDAHGGGVADGLGDDRRGPAGGVLDDQQRARERRGRGGRDGRSVHRGLAVRLLRRSRGQRQVSSAVAEPSAGTVTVRSAPASQTVRPSWSTFVYLYSTVCPAGAATVPVHRG